MTTLQLIGITISGFGVILVVIWLAYSRGYAKGVKDMSALYTSGTPVAKNLRLEPTGNDTPIASFIARLLKRKWG